MGPGTLITFSAPSSGASLATPSFTATTDADGVAQASVAANGVAGAYVVTATAEAIDQPVYFGLNNQALYTLNVHIAGAGAGSVEPMGGVYLEGDVVTLTATPETGSYLLGWSGDVVSTAQPLVFTMDSDKNITATFEPFTYTLAVFMDGDATGDVVLEPESDVYDYGAVVTLTAVFSPGVYFGGWTGSLLGADNPGTLFMDKDKVVTATFSSEPPIIHSLAVHVVGQGEVEPHGGTFVSGTLVALSAMPALDWFFIAWSGDLESLDSQASLLMDSNKTVTATFDQSPPITHTLTAVVSPTLSGSVMLDPPGPVYIENTPVQLLALPAQGFMFAGWSGDLEGLDNPEDRTVYLGEGLASYPVVDLAAGEVVVQSSNASIQVQNIAAIFQHIKH